MRIPNPTKLIPRPHQAIDVGRRLVELVPGLPDRGTEPHPELVSPPAPSAPAAKPAQKPAKPKPAKPKPKPAKPKPKAAKPKAAKPKAKKAKAKEPKPDRDPHHALNNPVGDPDPTAWPDPYDADGDELDPHPAEDLDTQAVAEKLKRDKLDD